VVTLAICSQKGGVGKTTVAVNLAYALAKRGWRTLLVDTDPQGSVGHSLSEKARRCFGFYDVVNDGKDANKLILKTRLPELSVLTSGQNHSFFQIQGDGVDGEAAMLAMLESIEPRGFDLVLIDTAAGLGDYSADALRVCDHVLIPQQAEPLGLRSLPQILKGIQQLRKQGKKLQVAGIVLTMVQADQKESAEVTREVRRIIPAKLLLDSMVPRKRAFLKASSVGVPLGLLYKKPPVAALVFDQMAAELETRMMLEDSDDEEEEYTRLMD